MVTGKEEAIPTFAKVRDIFYLCKDNVCLLVVFDAHSQFYAHYHAYDIHFTSHTFITTPDSLLDPHPLNTHSCFDTAMSQHTFVTLKFNVL